jgi:hypothetical protein
MEDPGEHFVGQYLKYINNCDFVKYNLQTKLRQGEIDVVGISSSERKVYICEVATHLTGIGLQYVKNNHPDNVDRLVKKFEKDIEYGNTNFMDFEQIYMLWTPFAKQTGENAKSDPSRDLQEIKKEVKSKFNIDLTIIANKDHLEAIEALRTFAAKISYAMTSPIMRFLQIEETLEGKFS